ncbi:DUF4932 domain-containing protein [Mangrovivirga cuniculi]|uniref:DUF4932 domain-containing protein n=1 Tax=Mangrovivirga cuniculi TaxID=2715131 RepID=A0A4D7JG61_9BACT|nr:DUF4932 domain-containing protein [Mangrovivirga cuniculi]QCK14601.1 hypothetical protein DCC35_07515 [Mangrovivirga cuniculi]
MKRKVSIILTLLICLSNIYGQEKIQSNKKLVVHFEKNIEFLGFIYSMAYEANDIETQKITVDGKELIEKDWHVYGYSFYKEYKSTLNSKNLARAASVADHIWLDKLANFLIRVPEFPHASIPEDLNPVYYLSFSKSKDSIEARDNARIFLHGLNEYYKEVDFDNYLVKNEQYYLQAEKEILNTLPSFDFISGLENYFDNEYTRYHMIPSLTLPKTMGFGGSYPDGGIYNIFGALDFQNISNPDSLNMGFRNEVKLRELSIHEFGHSFVYKSWAAIPDSLIEATTHLLTPIKDVMSNQGYNNWDAVINEHIVRTVELIIAKKYAPKKEYKALQKEYVEKRRFIYISIFKRHLNNYKINNSSFSNSVIECLLTMNR